MKGAFSICTGTIIKSVSQRPSRSTTMRLHIDSAAVAELPPWEQTREPKGDPKATAYTEKYCEEQHK